MFAKRPRFDDTFGVRMDLGADRIDPMSLRPSSVAGQLRVKPPVIVEQPGSVFDIFRGPSKDPFSELRARPGMQAPERLQPQTSPAAPPERRTGRDEQAGPAGGLMTLWRRLSVAQRIGLCVFAGWFLLASGLFVPAIVIAIVYFNLRRRKT
jgi:hypothetical protein